METNKVVGSVDMANDSLPLKDFYIPKYIFHPEDEREYISHPPCPVLVFINSKSGGQLGGSLLQTYVELLSKFQVFDLGKHAPEKVLQMVFGNLEWLKHNGDELAEHILDNLNLIVAGGDGTASWLLGVVCDLKLARPPPVATVPLGTGNNLPFSFGWGKKNPGTDCESVVAFLEQVKNAEKMNIDNWHLVMRMRAPEEGSCEPLAPLELPHALHAFHRVSSSDSLNKEGFHTFRGGFWNYFSMGLDAQVSYAFHSERKLHPERFKNQLTNQGTYLKLGFAQGIFSHDSSRNISQLAEIDVKKKAGDHWTTLKTPDNIKSIICLNLPSFSGGLNPWGMPNKKPKYKEFTPPYVDDGRIEVVGFKDAWQGLLLLFAEGHGTRLAQAHRIRFRFHQGAADHTYMRMDGEPWKQPLTTDKDHDDQVMVEISHHGQVTMLAVPNCRSRSIPKAPPDSPSAPSTPLNDDSSDDESQERRKFGAADTFKYPEDIDISHLA